MRTVPSPKCTSLHSTTQSKNRRVFQGPWNCNHHNNPQRSFRLKLIQWYQDHIHVPSNKSAVCKEVQEVSLQLLNVRVVSDQKMDTNISWCILIILLTELPGQLMIHEVQFLDWMILWNQQPVLMTTYCCLLCDINYSVYTPTINISLFKPHCNMLVFLMLLLHWFSKYHLIDFTICQCFLWQLFWSTLLNIIADVITGKMSVIAKELHRPVWWAERVFDQWLTVKSYWFRFEKSHVTFLCNSTRSQNKDQTLKRGSADLKTETALPDFTSNLFRNTFNWTDWNNVK